MTPEELELQRQRVNRGREITREIAELRDVVAWLSKCKGEQVRLSVGMGFEYTIPCYLLQDVLKDKTAARIAELEVEFKAL